MSFLPRLQRYVWREFVGPTALGLVLYTFVLLMNFLFFVASQALASDLGLAWALQMLALRMPQALVLTIPMATLLGVLIGLGRLSGDHEWVALQSAGFGPRFLLRSVALHGLVAATLAFVVYNVVFPQTNFMTRRLQQEALLGRNLTANLRPRIFLTDLPNLVLYVDELRAGSRGRLEGVWIYKIDPDTGQEQMFVAKSGDVYSSEDGSGRIEFDLQDGTVHTYRSAEPDSYSPATFGSLHQSFPPPQYFDSLRQPLAQTNLDRTPTELLAERRRAEAEKDAIIRGAATSLVEAEIHQRVALPLASVVFAVLAIPLGVSRVRSGKGAGFALSLLVILIYWVLFTTLSNQARIGKVPPWIGMWSANVLMLAWAGVAYWRLRRRGTPERRLVRALREFAAFDWAFRRAKSVPVPESATAVVAETPALRELPATGHRWISLIDRYIGVQYLKILVYAAASALVIYAVVELKNLSDDLAHRSQPVSLILSYFKYFAPGMFTFILPVGCLIGALVTFALLSRTGELTALKAGGLSARRATVPVLLLTLLLCGLYFHLQENIAPTTNRKAQEVKDRIQGRMARTYGFASGGRWTFGAEGRLYHYSLFDARTESFQGLSILSVDWDSARILDHRFAQTARWNGKQWELHNGWYRAFPDAGGTGPHQEFRRFAQETATLDPPDNFARREYLWTNANELPEQMTLKDLGRQIKLLDRSGYDTTKLRVAWHAKLAHPVTPLVMVLLGLPFAFRLGRRGSLYSIGVALIVVIVYWATLATFEALGLETVLPPVLAAWAPNVIYGCAGLYLLLFVRT